MMERTTYFTLPEVLEQLENNGYRGLITAFDRESQKQILFAEEGVYVISKGPRRWYRLVDLLRKEGNIPLHVLEDALADEKELNWQKSLGEILVEKGVLSQKALDQYNRRIVEEEVYDLFLWRGAKYTYDPSATPESVLGKQRGQATFWRVDPVKFGRQTFERIHQWNIHPSLIPHPTTIYTIDESQLGRLKDLGLTRQMIQEAQRFGELPLRSLMRETTLAKPELCHLIYTLLNGGVLFPMPLEVAAAKGQEAEGQGAWERAASFYGYICFASQLSLDYFRKYLECASKAKKEVLQESLGFVEELGWTLYEQGRFSDGASLAELALEFSPGNLSLITLAFHCHAQLANAEKVRQLGQVLGQLLVSKKRYSEAESHYQYLLQWFPEDLEFKASLADVYVKEKKISQGIELFQECAAVYEKQNKAEEALRIYKLILDVEPNKKDVAKRAKSIERKKFLKKALLIGGPVCLVLLVVLLLVRENIRRNRLEREANAFVGKLIGAEDKLGSVEDVKKRVEEGKEKALKQVLAQIQHIERLYQTFKRKYALTGAYETVIKRERSFRERKKKINAFLQKKQREWEEARERERQKKLRQKEKFNIAYLTKQEGKKLLKEGKVDKAIQILRESFQHFIEFYNTYPEASDIIHSPGFSLPMVIDSVPRGASVYFGTKEDPANLLGRTPFVYEYRVGETKFVFTFVADGFKKLITDRKLDPQWTFPPLKWDQFHVLRPTLNMKPVAYNNLPVGPVETSFTVFKNILFFGARDGRIYGVRFYKETAKYWNSDVVWQERTAGEFGEIFTSPVLVRSMVVIGNTSGELLGFTFDKTGKFKLAWKQPTGGEEEEGGPILDTPFVYQNPLVGLNRYYLAVGNLKGYCYVFRFTWGKRRLTIEPFFAYKSENRLVASPVVDFDEIFVAGTDNFLARFTLEYSKKMKTLAEADWFFEGGDDFLVRPVPCLDYILQGCKDQNLYVLHRKNGKLAWRVQYPGPIQIAPLVWDRQKGYIPFMKEYKKLENLEILWKKASKGKEAAKKAKRVYELQKKRLAYLKKNLMKHTYLILTSGNTLGLVRLSDLEQEALKQQARGKTLHLSSPSFPWVWKEQTKGNVAHLPHLVERKEVTWLFVVTDQGYILCYEISPKKSFLKWRYFTPYLTSDVFYHKGKLFFADKVRLRQKKGFQWEYRVNCLLVR